MNTSSTPQDQSPQDQLFETKKSRLLSLLKKKQKRTLKHLQNLEQQLATAHTWEDLHHTALLLQSNLYKAKKGMNSLEVDNWKTEKTETIPLDPHQEPHDTLASLFKKSKKLKKSIPHLEGRVNFIRDALDETKRHIHACEAASTLTELEELCALAKIEEISKQPSRKKKETKVKLPYREFISKSGLEIRVGRGARDNDALTFHYANGNDWWLHVRDCSGSHVIIKVQKGKDPDEEAILDACQLALYYSKAKEGGEGEILITQKKYIRKAPGKAHGAVQVSKHKSRRIMLSQERLDVLMQRKHGQ